MLGRECIPQKYITVYMPLGKEKKKKKKKDQQGGPKAHEIPPHGHSKKHEIKKVK